MDKSELISGILSLYEGTPGKEFRGIKLYDAPLIKTGCAADPLFEEFKKPGIIGPWYMTPNEWLPGAVSVISMFFPASDQVRSSNAKMTGKCSKEWSYARIEGQQFIADCAEALCSLLKEKGFSAVYPQGDGRFEKVIAGKGISGYDCIDEKTFASNWSERHAAFVCGLGTFGLSKGLITEKGMAGRFASVITDCALEADERPYTDIYEWCIKCGECARRCPAEAIDIDTGKDHNKCLKQIGLSKMLRYPRYGCGLCQTGVPCEFSRPNK